MWECKRLRLKAMRPQCEYLINRKPVRLIPGSLSTSEPFEPLRPLACELCPIGRSLIEQAERRERRVVPRIPEQL